MYAFRGPLSFSTVIGQLKGAEQDVLGAIIKNTRKKIENRDLTFFAIATIFRSLTFFLRVYNIQYGVQNVRNHHVSGDRRLLFEIFAKN